MRILLAEDDQSLSKALVTVLKKNSYIVDAVFNGEDALAYGLTDNYDGIILDIMMPEPNGLLVLKRLRSSGIKTPVMLLTARSELSDRVIGFDAGADDYLPKPFSMEEFLARLRAILRRRDGFVPDIITFKGVSLDKTSGQLSYQGKTVRLVARELQLMELLMENPRHIFRTESLLERIWGWESDVEVSIVWVYTSNLRKKFNEIKAPIEIRATRGLGYSLEVAADD